MTLETWSILIAATCLLTIAAIVLVRRQWLRDHRWAVQLGSLVLLNSYFISGFKQIPCVSLNCSSCPAGVAACPIRSLQQFTYNYQQPLFTLGFLGLVGLISGKMSCGWFCPFGLIQDWLHRIKTPKWKLSNRFGWSRYVILGILVGLIPLVTRRLWFCDLCPAGTLEAVLPTYFFSINRTAAGGLFFIQVVILLGFAAWMVVSRQPFCRFICPLGAIYSLFSRISRIQMKVDGEKCVRCNKCQKVCPVEVKIYQNPRDSQCLKCLECIDACPKKAIRN